MTTGKIYAHREVPFSIANYNAIRTGGALRGKESQSLVLVDHGLEQGNRTAGNERERAKMARTEEYEGRCNDAFRFWQWVALGLAIVFVSFVVAERILHPDERHLQLCTVAGFGASDRRISATNSSTRTAKRSEYGDCHSEYGPRNRSCS